MSSNPASTVPSPAPSQSEAPEVSSAESILDDGGIISPEHSYRTRESERQRKEAMSTWFAAESHSLEISEPPSTTRPRRRRGASVASSSSAAVERQEDESSVTFSPASVASSRQDDDGASVSSEVHNEQNEDWGGFDSHFGSQSSPLLVILLCFQTAR